MSTSRFSSPLQREVSTITASTSLSFFRSSQPPAFQSSLFVSSTDSSLYLRGPIKPRFYCTNTTLYMCPRRGLPPPLPYTNPPFRRSTSPTHSPGRPMMHRLPDPRTYNTPPSSIAIDIPAIIISFPHRRPSNRRRDKEFGTPSVGSPAFSPPPRLAFLYSYLLYFWSILFFVAPRTHYLAKVIPAFLYGTYTAHPKRFSFFFLFFLKAYILIYLTPCVFISTPPPKPNRFSLFSLSLSLSTTTSTCT